MIWEMEKVQNRLSAVYTPWANPTKRYDADRIPAKIKYKGMELGMIRLLKKLKMRNKTKIKTPMKIWNQKELSIRTCLFSFSFGRKLIKDALIPKSPKL